MFKLGTKRVSHPFLAPRNVRVIGMLRRRRVLPFREVGSGVVHYRAHHRKVSGKAQTFISGLGGRCRCVPSGTNVSRLLTGKDASHMLFALSNGTCNKGRFTKFTTICPTKAHERLRTFAMGAVLSCRGSHLRLGRPRFYTLIRKRHSDVLLTRVASHRIKGEDIISRTKLGTCFRTRHSSFR